MTISSAIIQSQWGFRTYDSSNIWYPKLWLLQHLHRHMMKTWTLSHLFILHRVTSPACLSPLPSLPFCLPCAHWPSYLCHLALTGSACFQTLKEGCPWFGQGRAQIGINGRHGQEQPHEGPGGVCWSAAAGISWQRSAWGVPSLEAPAGPVSVVRAEAAECKAAIRAEMAGGIEEEAVSYLTKLWDRKGSGLDQDGSLAHDL